MSHSPEKIFLLWRCKAMQIGLSDAERPLVWAELIDGPHTSCGVFDLPALPTDEELRRAVGAYHQLAQPAPFTLIRKIPKRIPEARWTMAALAEPKAFPKNCCVEVLEADMNRSLWNEFPDDDSLREKRRRQLREILLRSTAQDSSLHYYQGLHDVIAVVLKLCCETPRYLHDDNEDPSIDLETAAAVTSLLLTNRLRCFATPGMADTQRALRAMHAIVQQEDPPLATHLEIGGHGPDSHYAVSWIVTWFAHHVSNPVIMRRIFDFSAAGGSDMIIFLSAGLLLHFSSKIQSLDPSEFGNTFKMLSELPGRIEIGEVLRHRKTARTRRGKKIISQRSEPTIILTTWLGYTLKLARTHRNLTQTVLSGEKDVSLLPSVANASFVLADQSIHHAENSGFESAPPVARKKGIGRTAFAGIIAVAAFVVAVNVYATTFQEAVFL